MLSCIEMNCSPSRKIDRSIRAFVANGVKKVRITGGEPMIRRNLPDLISLLSEIPGVEDLSMTTNASFADRIHVARTLRSAGLQTYHDKS